jgi:hypothetical protein
VFKVTELQLLVGAATLWLGSIFVIWLFIKGAENDDDDL